MVMIHATWLIIKSFEINNLMTMVISTHFYIDVNSFCQSCEYRVGNDITQIGVSFEWNFEQFVTSSSVAIATLRNTDLDYLYRTLSLAKINDKAYFYTPNDSIESSNFPHGN